MPWKLSDSRRKESARARLTRTLSYRFVIISRTPSRLTRSVRVASSPVAASIAGSYQRIIEGRGGATDSSFVNRDHPYHQHQPPDPQRDDDPRHAQHLDTVAQKPTHIGLGAAVTAPDKEAHRDCERPTPGAQPPVDHPGAPAYLSEPEHVAAGLTAILQSATFTFRQMG